MPFITFKNEYHRGSFGSEASRIPLILFPGIHGNAVSLQFLAKAIENSSPSKYEIHIYQQTQFFASLEEQTQTIFNELNNIPDFQNCAFVGYSYGNILATLVAKKFKEQQQKEPLTLCIDGPAPELSRQRFSFSSPVAYSDLVSIFNYAAQNYNLSPVNFSLVNIPPQLGFELLTGFIIDKIFQANSSNPKVNEFLQSANYAKYNLLNLLRYNKTNPLKLEKLFLFSTNASREAYGNEAGWNEYANNITPLQNEWLTRLSHVELIEQSNCALIARMITQTLDNHFTKSYILDLTLTELVNNVARTNQMNFDDAKTFVLERLAKSSPSTSPVGSPPSSGSDESPTQSDGEEDKPENIMPMDISGRLSPEAKHGYQATNVFSSSGYSTRSQSRKLNEALGEHPPRRCGTTKGYL